MLARFAVSLVLLAAALPAAAQDELITIAVVDFANRGADDVLVKECNGRVNAELHKLGVFKVTSKDDIRAMISHEREKTLLGCDDASCLAEIGGALGVEYLVTGTIARVDKSHTIDLRLVNIRKATVENVRRETVTGTAGEVIEKAGDAAVGLVSKLFAAKQGFLALVSQEAGATVKIDGVEWTTTPVPGRITLPFGPHVVEVSKTGFLTWRERVTIQPNQGVERVVSLVPSPDFIDAYESTNGKLRTGAWIATVVAVGAAGAAGYFAIDADAKYDEFKPLQTQLNEDPRLSDVRAQATDLASQIESRQQVTLISGGVALLSAGIATWLWVAGDDPDKYERWRVVDGPKDAPKEEASSVELDLSRGFALRF